MTSPAASAVSEARCAFEELALPLPKITRTAVQVRWARAKSKRTATEEVWSHVPGASPYGRPHSRGDGAP